MVSDFLMNGADQVRTLGVVELEAEIAFGVGLGASGFFHALAQAEQDNLISSGGLVGRAVLDIAGEDFGDDEENESTRLVTARDRATPDETDRENVSDAELERAIVDAVTMGAVVVAKALAGRLEERRRERAGNVVPIRSRG